MEEAKERAKDILERLPEDKLLSAIDYLEFLEQRSLIPVVDNGQEVIIGPAKDSQEVFRTFERWRVHSIDKEVRSEDVRVDSIMAGSHDQLVRIVAPYRKTGKGQ